MTPTGWEQWNGSVPFILARRSRGYCRQDDAGFKTGAPLGEEVLRLARVVEKHSWMGREGLDLLW